MTTTATGIIYERGVSNDINDYEDRLTRAASTQSDLSELRAKLADIEAAHVVLVAAEKGEDGKSAYTNDAARSAALRLAMEHDEEAITLQSNIAERERTLGQLKAQAAAQEMRVRLGLAWIRFLARDGGAE